MKLIKFLKTIRWWMYLPFACFFMTDWVFVVDDDETWGEGCLKSAFFTLNVLLTCVVFAIIIMLLFFKI